MLKTILRAVGLVSVPRERIIGAMKPWTLCCAVGAENGSIGSTIGFDMWLRLSKKNWMLAVEKCSGASERQIEAALRTFVAANKHKNCNMVLNEVTEQRGLAKSVVLGPGESMTVTLSH